MQAVILAAGVGTRLGRPFPKSLSVLPSGEKILGRQIRLLRDAGVQKILIVVGFKMALIMEDFPDVHYSYNPVFYVTNTSKSLLHGLRDLDDDVIWMNGDVIFDEGVLPVVLSAALEANIVCVDTKRCADEEVKYRKNTRGCITEISKTVQDGEGEALGINLIRKKDLPAFKAALERCDDMDYFERGLEYIINEGVNIVPLDISAFRCVEVDFAADWELARKIFAER